MAFADNKFVGLHSFGKLKWVLPALSICLFINTAVFSAGSSEPRWSLSIADNPVIAGDVVVSSGFASTKRYTAAAESTTVTVTMNGAKLQSIMIMNRESKVTCINTADTVVSNENGRLVFSGSMGCMTNPANRSERDSLMISGWFGLDE